MPFLKLRFQILRLRRLEEEKIRLLEKKDRQRLHKFDKTWHRALLEYCKDIGLKFNPDDWNFDANAHLRLEVLDGLLSLAVHDIYQDKTDAADIKMPPAEAAMEGAERQFTALIPALNRIFTAWGLPLLPDDAKDDDIYAGLLCVQSRVGKSEGQKLTNELEHLPLGIDTDDAEVNRMVGVLRVLHGQELRKLQCNINDILTQLQDLTADPKTDSRLGRVGR
eukprot:GEMP01067060.1.p1 GENE.GEMP01067060.1~~GEMP01067060.1.p1  ORF type:complete len:222 (+),score=49.23 GEMP01067060.1:135-800(+)